MIAWPDQLILDLARRRSIIMIGSGVSRHSQGDGGAIPPTWHNFLSDALNLCNPKPKHIQQALNRGRYLDACEWLMTALDERWAPFLRQAFLRPRYRSAKIHELIYALDSRIVLTPNFDKIYDNLAASSSEATIPIKSYGENDIIEYLGRGDRVVIKAHGSIDNIQSMVFTRSQYIEARHKHANFYNLLDSLLCTHTVLMIGVGLDDPDFQMLFEDHAHKFRSNIPHYMAFGGNPPEDLVSMLRKTRNVKLLPYSSRYNHAALISSLEALLERVAEVRSDLAIRSDW